jgi:translation initiation factor IF-3
LNDEITAPQVRLIGANGEQVGVVPLEQAQQASLEADLDLVEISPNAEPPVCKIMDFGKFRFEENKKRHEAKKKQKQVQVKEVKFRPGTDIGDYQVKLRNLTRFLEDGDKAKVTLRFRGREMAHQELGLELLQRVEKDLEEISTVEQLPRREGRLMVMVLAPRKNRK